MVAVEPFLDAVIKLRVKIRALQASMHFLQIALAAAGTAQIAKAHTAFTNFFVDGVDQGDGVAVRMSNNMGQATFPISSVTSKDMACGMF